MFIKLELRNAAVNSVLPQSDFYLSSAARLLLGMIQSPIINELYIFLLRTKLSDRRPSEEDVRIRPRPSNHVTKNKFLIDLERYHRHRLKISGGFLILKLSWFNVK